MDALNCRIGIFKEKDEIVHLLVPFAIPCIAIGLWIASLDHRPYFDFRAIYWLRFLVAVIFLDLIHATLSIFIAFNVPEARQWLFDRSRAERIRIWLGLITMALFSIVFLKDGMIFLANKFSDWHVDLWFVFLFAFISQSHHILKQSQGLSLNYNRQIERLPLDSSHREQIMKSERWERPLFRWLIFFFGVGYGVRILSSTYPILTHLKIPVAVLIGLNAVLIIVNAAKFPVFKGSNKVLYLSRLLCLPLGLLLGIPLFIGYLYHGPEYFFTMRKMYDNSNAKTKTKFRILAWVLIIAGIAAFRLIMNPYNGLGYFFQYHFSTSKNGLAWLGSISVTIAWFHILFDNRIFRMKSPRARKFIGPLLFVPISESAKVVVPPELWNPIQETI